MRNFLFIVWVLLTLAIGGCSFHRSDFVCGPNGKAQDDQLSDSGKTLGNFLRFGPHYNMNY